MDNDAGGNVTKMSIMTLVLNVTIYFLLTDICLLMYYIFFQNFFQLFRQPPCKQFSWVRKTASYNIFEYSTLV
jgi:hypothetical protein